MSERRQHAEHHKKFVWNWRMLILGLILNLMTFGLVAYTVSLLNEYRSCTQTLDELTRNLTAQQRKTDEAVPTSATETPAPTVDLEAYP